MASQSYDYRLKLCRVCGKPGKLLYAIFLGGRAGTRDYYCSFQHAARVGVPLSAFILIFLGFFMLIFTISDDPSWKDNIMIPLIMLFFGILHTIALILGLLSRSSEKNPRRWINNG